MSSQACTWESTVLPQVAEVVERPKDADPWGKERELLCRNTLMVVTQGSDGEDRWSCRGQSQVGVTDMVQSLGGEDHLKQGTATHSNISQL